MRDALARILVLPKEHESDEDLYDICRAYGLLLNVCCKSQFQETRIYAGEVPELSLLLMWQCFICCQYTLLLASSPGSGWVERKPGTGVFRLVVQIIMCMR